MKFMNEDKNCIRASIFVLVCLILLITGCVTTDGNGAKTEKEVTPANKKADIYAKLATGYMEKEQYEIAQGELNKALQISPNHSQSNYIMGLLMIKTQQYALVEQFISKAIESDPKNSSAAHDLGGFLCQTGQELRSISYFEKAVANPYFKRPELSLMRAGECLNKIGQSQQAEVYLKKSLTVNPRLKPALFNLAKIKYESGSYLSARAYIERFLAITKPQPASLLLGYQIELKLNANDVASKYRARLLESFPSSEQARSLRNNL